MQTWKQFSVLISAVVHSTSDNGSWGGFGAEFGCGGFWKNSGRILEGFWEDSGRILGGFWEDSERILGGFWKDSVRNMDSKDSEKILQGFWTDSGWILDGFFADFGGHCRRLNFEDAFWNSQGGMGWSSVGQGLGGVWRRRTLLDASALADQMSWYLMLNVGQYERMM